jgi:hypothetical protein
MKISTFTFLSFVVLASTANAQKFTILPQVGLENLTTRVSYNNLETFKPLQSLPTPTLGVRMDYKVKKLAGVFTGLSTTRPGISYSFANPETGMNAYTVSAGNIQLQLQAGLQATTKPIFFSKSAAAKPSTTTTSRSGYGRCGSNKAMGRCGSKNKTQASKPAQNQSWFVRIMPSAGFVVNPFTKTGMITNKTQGAQDTYTYNGGSFKTGIVTGVGFEFGSQAQRRFTVNINYLRGFDNNAESITSQADIKTVTTNLSSTVSGWNASIGIPLSLGKKPVVRKVEHKKYEYRQYQRRSSCGRRVI